MRLLSIAICIIFSSANVFSQWNIVRGRSQEDGIHTYLALTSSDGKTIYACGAVRHNVDDYVIEKSVDGGYTWTRLNTDSFPLFPIPLNDKFHGIATFDGINVIAVADSGLIVSTHDGGETWYVRNRSKLNFNDVYINNSGVAVVTGNYGSIGISQDTGRSWNFQELIDSTTFLNCKIFGRDTIYLVDRFYANFFRSFDGGVTWDSVKLFPQAFDGTRGAQFYDAHFWTAKEGIVVGLNKDENSGTQVYNNCIVHTTDYGLTWTVDMDSLMPYTNGLQRVYFWNQNIGIIGTRGRDVLLTHDGGNSWRQDSIIIENETIRATYSVLAFEDSYLACAKTELGNGEIVLSIKKLKVAVEDSAEPRVYPNPVTTYINVSEFNGQRIKIIDVIGRVLFDGIIETNQSIDCTNFTLGVYTLILYHGHNQKRSVKFIKQ